MDTKEKPGEGGAENLSPTPEEERVLKHISQDILDRRIEPRVEDTFDHGALARRLYGQFATAPDGSVIAIDAPWGRGKSDVLHRVALLHNGRWDEVDEDGNVTRPKDMKKIPLRALWITPWMSKDANLLGEIVLECMRRAVHAPRDKLDKLEAFEEIERLSQFMIYPSLGLAGSYAQGSLSNYLQARHLLKAREGIGSDAYGVATDIVEEIFKVFREEKRDEALETTPQVFAKMIRALVKLSPKMKWEGAGDRLLIFIDDIDRCLPEHQVAILEAIHFLTIANAPIVFFMAIDSALAARAIAIHYRMSEADYAPLVYLDKILFARIALAASPPFDKLFKGLMRTLDGGEALDLDKEFMERTSSSNSLTTLEQLVRVHLATAKSETGAILGYNVWEAKARESIRGTRNLNPRAWQLIFEVFRLALRDDERRVTQWVAHPETFWPWICLRVRHYSIARRVMDFFSSWSTLSASSRNDSHRHYTSFLSGLGLGLEHFQSRTSFQTDDDGGARSIDAPSTQIALLLAACGLHKRGSLTEVNDFLEKEYRVIEAFEKSCAEQGLGSVMRDLSPSPQEDVKFDPVDEVASEQMELSSTSAPEEDEEEKPKQRSALGRFFEPFLPKRKQEDPRERIERLEKHIQEQNEELTRLRTKLGMPEEA